MRRTAILIAITGLTLAALPGCSGRIAELRQAVDEPRDGRPLGQVAVVYSNRYIVRLGGAERLHPFPIYKYDRAYRKLVREGVLEPEDIFVPEALSQEQIRLVHTPDYADLMQSREGVARILHSPGINLIPRRFVQEGIVDAFMAASGGTVLAGQLAIEHGIAMNIGGGYNHASAEYGHGFSMIADVPIAIRQLQADGQIRRAMIVDLDLHQGNGPAKVFLPNDPDVYVFDMFEERNNPKPKVPERYAVPLARRLSSNRYIEILRDHLPRAIDEARPDIIFYVAGTDVHWADLLGHLNLTVDGVVRRDMFVVEQARRRGIPIAIVTGGGYSPASWQCIYRTTRSLVETYGKTSAQRPAVTVLPSAQIALHQREMP